MTSSFATAMNRVWLEAALHISTGKISRPFLRADSSEEIAASEESPCFFTSSAANAVLSEATESHPYLEMISEHCEIACGWLVTVRISESFVPGRTARVCATAMDAARTI